MNVFQSKCRNPMNKICLMSYIYAIYTLTYPRYTDITLFRCFNLSHSIHLCVFYFVQCLSLAVVWSNVLFFFAFLCFLSLFFSFTFSCCWFRFCFRSVHWFNWCGKQYMWYGNMDPFHRQNQQWMVCAGQLQSKNRELNLYLYILCGNQTKKRPITMDLVATAEQIFFPSSNLWMEHERDSLFLCIHPILVLLLHHHHHHRCHHLIVTSFSSLHCTLNYSLLIKMLCFHFITFIYAFTWTIVFIVCYCQD